MGTLYEVFDSNVLYPETFSVGSVQQIYLGFAISF